MNKSELGITKGDRRGEQETEMVIRPKCREGEDQEAEGQHGGVPTEHRTGRCHCGVDGIGGIQPLGTLV